jgi:hypothetical protein
VWIVRVRITLCDGLNGVRLRRYSLLSVLQVVNTWVVAPCLTSVLWRVSTNECHFITAGGGDVQGLGERLRGGQEEVRRRAGLLRGGRRHVQHRLLHHAAQVRAGKYSSLLLLVVALPVVSWSGWAYGVAVNLCGLMCVGQHLVWRISR